MGPEFADFRHLIYHCYKAMEEPDIVAAMVIAKTNPVLNSFGPSYCTMVDVLAFCNPPGSDQTFASHAARYPAQAITAAVADATKVTASIENLS